MVPSMCCVVVGVGVCVAVELEVEKLGNVNNEEYFSLFIIITIVINRKS